MYKRFRCFYKKSGLIVKFWPNSGHFQLNARILAQTRNSGYSGIPAISTVRCSPYRYQGDGMAEKSVDTLKNMIRKKKMRITELCHNLNNTRRVGYSASPMEMFFKRPVKGHLPNQFARENDTRLSVEGRITEQFKTALKKGWYNRDKFFKGDLVRVQSPKGTWDIHREVMSRRSTENRKFMTIGVLTQNFGYFTFLSRMIPCKFHIYS